MSDDWIAEMFKGHDSPESRERLARKNELRRQEKFREYAEITWQMITMCLQEAVEAFNERSAVQLNILKSSEAYAVHIEVEDDPKMGLNVSLDPVAGVISWHSPQRATSAHRATIEIDDDERCIFRADGDPGQTVRNQMVSQLVLKNWMESLIK